MPSNVRRFAAPLRLNDRVLAPVRQLARMAGVSPEEILEFLLAELFEGDVAPVPAAPLAPRPPARVIPITRRRTWPRKRADLSALRQRAETTRRRAQEARRLAAAACEAAGSARDLAARLVRARGR